MGGNENCSLEEIPISHAHHIVGIIFSTASVESWWFASLPDTFSG